MNFKSTEGAQIYITNEGKICIKQNSFEFGKDVHVFLTFNQFMATADWLKDMQEEIEEIWNDGIAGGDDYE